MQMRRLSTLGRLAASLAIVSLALGGAGKAPTAAAAPAALQNLAGSAAPLGGEAPPDPATPPGCTAATQTQSNNTVMALPDQSTITSTISLNGLGAYIWDVDVTTQISHSYSADLEVFLISPAGLTVTLTTDNGGARDNSFNGTLWTDQAGLVAPPGAVTDAAYPSDGVVPFLAPEEPLNALLGQNPNGAWKLVVQDDAVNDTGALLGWSLRVIALNESPAELLSVELEGVHDAIPDGGTLTTTLTVIDQHAPLSGVSLEPDIDHSHSSDLSIYLRSPNNVTLTVSTGNGLAGVFDGTEWYDAAGAENPPGPVTDNAMTAGVVEPYLSPEEPFAAVNGMDGNGDWLLTITDNVVNGSTGDLGAIWLFTRGAACRPQVNVYSSYDPQYVRVGVPVTYTVWAGNDGYTATNVILTSTLPLNAPFLAGSAPGLDCVFPPVESVGGTVVCTRPTLGPQEYLAIDLRLRPPSLPALMTSTAEITHAGIDLYADDAHDDESEESYFYSANGNPWDVDDRHGGIDDGGQDAFDTWGQLRLRIYEGGTLLETTQNLSDFNLTPATGGRWLTTTPVLVDTLSVARALHAPASENWLRYVDTITNLGANARTVYVTWGGDLGSDDETKLDTTSSGNLVLDTGDTWATTIDDSYPEIDAPVGYVLRNLADPTYQGPRRSTHPLTDPWPATGDDDLGHVYRLDLAPGETERLAYFVIRGLGEGQAGPEDCEDYGGCTTPVTGTQAVAVRFVALGLAVNPPLCDVLGSIANWPGAQDGCERVYLPTILR